MQRIFQRKGVKPTAPQNINQMQNEILSEENLFVQSYYERLENYFKPGKIVPSYCGRDRVIKIETNLIGWPSWKVTVEELNEAGEAVAPPRWHCTNPHEQF